MEISLSAKKPGKKIDIWGGIKKVWAVAKGPISSLIKTAVGFIPGIGPVLSNILGKGLSIIAPDAQTAGGYADIIKAGKDLLKGTPGANVTDFVMNQVQAKGLKIDPTQIGNIVKGVETPGTVNVTDDQTVRNKLLNQMKKIEEQETVTEKSGEKIRKSSSGVVYTLFARADPTVEEGFKADRKKLRDNIANMEKNIDILNKKMGKVFYRGVGGKYFGKGTDIANDIQNRLNTVWNNIVNIKGEIKTVSLKDEPFVKVDLKGARMVLARYDQEIVRLFKVLEGLNQEIDDYVSRKKTVATVIETKKKEEEISDIGKPKYLSWLIPAMLITGVSVTGAYVIPKMMKTRGRR